MSYHDPVFGPGGRGREKDRDTIKGRAGRVCFCCPAACIATHCLHTAAQRMGGRGGGEKEREGERGRGKYSIGFRTVRSSPVPPHPSL